MDRVMNDSSVVGVALRRLGRLATGVALVFLAGAGETLARCASEPPPKGLVERCRGLNFRFTDSTPDSIKRSVLNITLYEWMRTCVIPERALGLIGDAEASIDRVYELTKDLPFSRGFVKIIPEYTPLTYSEGGRTCYGVKSVSFRVAGASATVVEPTDDEIEMIAGPTSDMVKEAAAAGIQALRDPSVQGSAALSRFLSVLEQMAKHGSDFDDTWYNVQPYATGDPMSSVACYKGPSGCAPADEALKACERHLADELVQSYHYDKVSPKRYAEILDIKADDIQRGIDHLHVIQSMDSPGALPCPSIATVFMPRIAELARKHSVYGAGGY